MDIAGVITLLSIVVECMVAAIAVLIATRNKKAYGWLVATTFALFALFDGVRIVYPYGFSRLSEGVLLIACVSMLYAVWLIYNDTLEIC